MPRSFNGSSDKIVADAAHSWTNLGNWSVVVRFKTSASQSNTEMYIEQAPGNFAVLGISDTGNALRWTVNGADLSGYRVPTVPGSAVNDGLWHDGCWTQDSGGNFALYLDAVSIGSGTATPTNFTPTTLTISAATAGSNWFSGTLGHIATWNRKLSAKEVASLSAGLLPSHLGPLHYWTLYGNDSPEPDIGTGTKVAGTLSGTAIASGGRAGLRPLVLA